MIPKAVKRALHYSLALIGLILCLILVLALTGRIQLPPTAVAIWGLALPVLVAGFIGGAIAPVVPGVLMLSFRRYSLGDHIVIGPVADPLAQGIVTHLDVYSTTVTDAAGRRISVANQIIHGLPVTRI